MHCSAIFTLLLGATSVLSAPSRHIAAPRALTQDDILLTGANGRMEVMSRHDYENALKHGNSSLGHLEPKPKFSNVTWTPTSTTNRTPVAERCSKETIWTTNAPTTFLNWDVPMSSVLHATDKDATISVTEGYSIANAVGVSISSTLSTVESFLSTSFGIDYTETWTSTYNSAYTFTVKAGQYGIVVSNPKTTRHTGSVKIGCVGEAGDTSTFQADSYTSQSYGSLSWVTGTISLCTGTTYPIPMCSGDGTLS